MRVMDTKVTTVIVNATNHGLTMKAGNCQCYAKLTSFKVGGKYNIRIDVNWTYQEFVVQDKCLSHSPLLFSSDDCCDYESITIHEVDGKFDVEKVLRRQFRTTSCTTIEEEPTISPTISPTTWKSWLWKLILV